MISPGGRVMALDVGEKTIGLAVSDSALRTASALQVLHRTKFSVDAQKLKEIMKEHKIAAFVVGLPVNMDGSSGKTAQRVQTFVSNFLKIQDIPVIFWDERLSTQAMEREMISHDVTRERRAKAIDKMAAVIILQGFLGRLESC